ncbi:mismatch-specific DNA-glycosylase [Sphaerisporangium aureirubrum]|uniref:Mismatch-specific DNA-glycosylase n=1 Tax=Sphaerisporangium aureirubrum TaxID=1544736 RepID=A0ABW1NFG4_9ACTN
MRFGRTELEKFRGGTLPDLLGPDVRLLFVGINPGLRTVAVQTHFGRPGNRFYPALYRAGIVDRLIGVSDGLSAADAAHMKAQGIGITNIVPFATARADELTTEQLVEGGRALAARVGLVRPNVVAVLGVTAYRVAFRRPKAVAGKQPEDIGGVPLWIAPNPSGLNAHETAGSLAEAYREAAVAAGVPLFPPPRV